MVRGITQNKKMRKIRTSIFETNSSSTHVFALRNGGEMAGEQLNEFVNNKELIKNFKYSIFKTQEDEDKCFYWMTFEDFAYCSEVTLTKWKYKLDFWLQAITLYIIYFNDDLISKIEEKTAPDGLNTNDKLLWASNGNRVLQDVWVKLATLLNITPKNVLVKPELHVTELMPLDSGFNSTPMCDDYFVYDENSNIIGVKEDVLKKIALSIIDPASTIFACAYKDDDYYKDRILKNQKIIKDLYKDDESD